MAGERWRAVEVVNVRNRVEGVEALVKSRRVSIIKMWSGIRMVTVEVAVGVAVLIRGVNSVSERVSKSRLVFVVIQGVRLVKAVAVFQHVQATLVSSLSP